MLKEKDVKLILTNNIIPILQKQSYYAVKKDDSKDEFYLGYKLACDYRDKVAIHAEIGGFPKKLFAANAPNESPAEKEYIEKNFKQTTQPVYVDYHSTMSRMFADNDWHIKFKPDEDKYKEQSFQSYWEQNIHVFGSLENYFKSLVLHLRNVDANGVIAVKPHEIIKNLEDGTQSEITETDLYEPQPYYYRCDQVVGREYNKYFLILLDEKSIVSVGDAKQKVGNIFELYDETNIWRITQTGKKEDYKFTYEIYFNHNEGVIPCYEMRGLPQLYYNTIVWQSKFMYACDLLDIALVLSHYLRATHSNSCFPYRVMLGNRCTNRYIDSSGVESICNHGKVYDTTLSKEINCTACGGFGLVDRVNRMGQMLIEPDSQMKQGDGSQMAANAMYYVSPETATLEFTQNFIKDTTEQARALLHLKTSSTKAQPDANGNTAIGDTLDNKAMTAFIRPEAFQVFTLLENVTHSIGWQRYANDYKQAEFKYPDNFDTTTDSDYLKRISEMQATGVPTVLIESEIDKYVKSLFFNDKDSQDRYRLIAHTDRLFFLSQEDIISKLSKGTASKWESVLHDSANALIEELILERENDKSNVNQSDCVYPYVCQPMQGFFSNEFKTQKELLIAKAKEVTENIQTDSPDSPLSIVNSIMNKNTAA